MVCTCYSHLHAQSLSRVWLSVTPWTVARQAPLSMGFSRQEYWSGLPYTPPGDLPDLGIELRTPPSPELAGRFFNTEPPRKPIHTWGHFKNTDRSSLVGEWIRSRLPMQGTWVRPLAQEDSTGCGAATPRLHNYWARVLWLLKPTCLQPVLRNKRTTAARSRCAAVKSSTRSLQL